MLINLGFSEKCSKHNQNESQSAYFGNNSFSLFTVFALYSNQGAIRKIPILITTEVSEKSKIASASCVDILLKYLRSQVDKEFDTIYGFSD